MQRFLWMHLIGQFVADTAISTSVILSGSTSSGVEKNQAAVIARKVPGVRSVRNQIKIKR